MRSTLLHSCKSTAICNCGNADKETAAVPMNVEEELPEDVMIEILLRLPIKSLFRFKSVRKSWYDIILSPNFIKQHDSISLANKTRGSIFLHSLNYHNLATTISFRFFDAPLDLTIYNSSSVDMVDLVGCCNGLVCISHSVTQNEFALWNPATRHSRLIYVPCNNYYHNACWTHCGFFSDSMATTYKLVRISFFARHHHEVPKGTIYVTLHVFTSNDNSTREKYLLAPCRIPRGGMMSETTYISRFMYWTVSHHRVRDKYILCFDIVDEVFDLIELPFGDRTHYDMELVDYKGSLAVFVWEELNRNPSGHFFEFEMWVSTGGTIPSWRKQFALATPVANVKRPLGFYSNGDVDYVVLSTHGQCVLWDRDSGEITELFYGSKFQYQFLPYSETFASVY